MLWRSAVLGFVALSAVACSADTSEDAASGENDVKVDTKDPLARAQYDADVAFANGYVARCKKPEGSTRPRVLVTGFGRFMGILNNATGRIVSTLVPDAKYPETVPAPAGQIDPPEPQLSVATMTLDWPLSGKVDVCAMILPVYWDLASILISKELDAFEPSMVLMNGVAGSRQEIWLELGATNRAEGLGDGSDILRPFLKNNATVAKLVDGGDDAQPNLMSWDAVHAAAADAVAKHAKDVDDNTILEDLLPGAKLAGFPRSSNTYLCNNVTYVTGWLMSHPGKSTRLLKASKAEPGKPNDVTVKLANDFSKTPRMFVHWPSTLDVRHHAAGAAIMEAILDAQVNALAKNDLPKAGDNANADPDLKGGDTF
jgi:pyrrolidone-carboxylate peptidase